MLPLAGDLQRLAAGGQHAQAGAGGQQARGQRRAGVQQVLAVVQHQQQRPRPQGGDQAVQQRHPRRLAHAQGGRHGLGHQRRVGEGGQLHQPDPVREPRPPGPRPGSAAPPSAIGSVPAARLRTRRRRPRARQGVGDLQGQAGLAAAAHAGQGHQAHARLAQQGGQGRRLALPADQGGGRRRQVGGGGARRGAGRRRPAPGPRRRARRAPPPRGAAPGPGPRRCAGRGGAARRAPAR